MIREIAALVVGALVACQTPAAIEGPVRSAATVRTPVLSDLLEMDAEHDTLNLINRTTDPIYYFVSEWAGPAIGQPAAPCTDPAICESVGRRDTRRIAFGIIPGVNPATKEILVLHWRLVSAAPNPGFMPDSVRATIVPLQR